MTWRELRKTDEYLRYISDIWEYEQNLPAWYKVASSVWTRDLEEFTGFAKNCQEIFALFDETGDLIVCVYIERQNLPHIINIHLSILGKIPPAIFVAESEKLRNILLRRGVTNIRGWILNKNFALRKMMSEIGFIKTSLRMKFGSYRNQVLCWNLYELRRG